MEDGLVLIQRVMQALVKSTDGGDCTRKINPRDYKKWFSLMRKMYEESGSRGKNKLLNLAITDIPHLSIISYMVLLENNIVVEKLND